jgi:hypothetical protein
LKEFIFKMYLTDQQNKEVRNYVNFLTTEMIIFGLRFAYSRSMAISGGYLMPGRKSIVKKETHMLNKSQAKWRLENWKSIIKTYRNKGYSYPTISRIKKEMKKITESSNKKN